MSTNERPGTDHKISGPMRCQEEEKTAPDGANRQTERRTWTLYDRIGPVGPIHTGPIHNGGNVPGVVLLITPCSVSDDCGVPCSI